MRKYYQYFGLALIMFFSFYYTEKIALIVLNKNPLMVEINEQKANYEESFVNAIINGDYIIPGINGLQVNAKSSFYNMQELSVFNKYYLVYDQVIPDISITNNKDKIIKQGNPKLKQVSLILSEEGTISEYLKNNLYKANLLIDNGTYNSNNYFEVINNDSKAFESLENALNLNKENKHICVINSSIYNICLKNKNYLVEPTLTLTSNNIIEVKNNINNGSIILIEASAKLSDIQLLIKEIKFKGYNLVYLSELINEENNPN